MASDNIIQDIDAIELDMLEERDQMLRRQDNAMVSEMKRPSSKIYMNSTEMKILGNFWGGKVRFCFDSFYFELRAHSALQHATFENLKINGKFIFRSGLRRQHVLFQLRRARDSLPNQRLHQPTLRQILKT